MSPIRKISVSILSSIFFSGAVSPSSAAPSIQLTNSYSTTIPTAFIEKNISATASHSSDSIENNLGRPFCGKDNSITKTTSINSPAQRKTSTLLNMATMDSPSAERNKEPIWSTLRTTCLPKQSTKKQPYQVLEIAAGCGVHTAYFSSQIVKNCKDTIYPLSWYPTEPDESSRLSIVDRIQIFEKEHGDDQMAKIHQPTPLLLNENGVMECNNGTPLLPNDETMFDLIICINMIHISPWTATVGLMKLASERLKEGGILYCYGPYKVDGTAVPSNLNFDASLKARDPEWGVRNLEDVTALAETCGLILDRKVEMPANNLSVLFRKPNN